MRISQLSTLAKNTVSSTDYLLTANTSTNTNKKTLVQNLFPTITNHGSTVGAVSVISAVANKNEYTLSKIKVGSAKLAISGGGGGADISIDLGTVNFSDLTGTVTNAQLGGSIDLTSKVTGILPIANGGTGSSGATYCSLTANVTGTLPVANGGTGLTSYTANRIVYASGSGTLGQLSTVGSAGQFLLGTGSKPIWASPSNTSSISWATTASAIEANVIAIPALSGNIGWAVGGGREVKPANNGSGAGDALTIAAGTSTHSSIGGQLNLNAGGGGASTGGEIKIKSGGTATGAGNWGGTITLQQQGNNTATITDVVKVYQTKVGISNNQAASIVPSAQLEVEQSDGGSALAVLKLDQDNTAGEFIHFEGQDGAAAAHSISTLHGTFPNHTNANDGWIRVNVNGTDKWIPYFHTPA